jgi:hypothetical protein
MYVPGTRHSKIPRHPLRRCAPESAFITRINTSRSPRPRRKQPLCFIGGVMTNQFLDERFLADPASPVSRLARLGLDGSRVPFLHLARRTRAGSSTAANIVRVAACRSEAPFRDRPRSLRSTRLASYRNKLFPLARYARLYFPEKTV